MGFVKRLEEVAEKYRENAEFYDAEILTVYFGTKAEIVEKLLPPPLKPTPIPAELLSLPTILRPTLV